MTTKATLCTKKKYKKTDLMMSGAFLLLEILSDEKEVAMNM